MKPGPCAVACTIGTLLLAGCTGARRPATPVQLQQVAGYPVLSPLHRVAAHGDMQDTIVLLGPLARPNGCGITGRIFSLAPPSATGRDGWTVTSPSVAGWQVPQPDTDLRSEWASFTTQLAHLQGAGCFGSHRNAASAQRVIADAIPVPADEALVFQYGFTGSGIVDLLPGMLVRVERSLLAETPHGRELQSLEATYAVRPSGADGVLLHRTQIQTLHRSERPPQIFGLAEMAGAGNHLRLYLQQAAPGTGAQRPSMLLVEDSAEAIAAMSPRLESAGCTAAVAAGKCIAFQEAVSLLVACRVNGKPQIFALSTTVAQALDLTKGDLQRVRLRRRQVTGGFAEVEFPRTADAAARLILQAGDELDWR